MAVVPFIPLQLPWLFDALCGQQWPAGDEDALSRSAQAWDDALKAVADLAGHGDDASLGVLSTVASISAEQFAQYWSQYTGGAINDSALGQLAAQAQSMAAALYGQANEVEYTKLSIDVTIVLTAIQILWAIAASAFSMGGSLAEIPLATFFARQSVLMLVSRLVQMVAMMMIPDLISQGWMLLVDHRETSWDWGKTGAAAENAVAAGVIGTFLGAGMAKLPFMGEEFGKTIGGKVVQGLAHFAEGGAVMDLTTLATAGVNYTWAYAHGDTNTMQAIQQQITAANLWHQFVSGGMLATAFYLPHLAAPHGSPLSFTGADGNRYQVLLDDKVLEQFKANGQLPDGFRAPVYDQNGLRAGTATFNGPEVSFDHPVGGSPSVDLSQPGNHGGFSITTHDGTTTRYGFQSGTDGSLLPDGTVSGDGQPKPQVLSRSKPSDGSVVIDTKPTPGSPSTPDASMTVPPGSMVHYTPDGKVFRADLADPHSSTVTVVQTGDPGGPLRITGHTVYENGPGGVGKFLGIQGATLYGPDGSLIGRTSAVTGHTTLVDQTGLAYTLTFGDHYDPFAATATATAGAHSAAPTFEPPGATAPTAGGSSGTGNGQAPGPVGLLPSPAPHDPQQSVVVVADPNSVLAAHQLAQAGELAARGGQPGDATPPGSGQHADPVPGQQIPSAAAVPGAVRAGPGEPTAWRGALVFTDTGEAMAYAEGVWGHVADQLTPEQRNAVLAFTGEAIASSHEVSYQAVNRFLRGEIPETPEIRQAITLLDGAVRLQAVPENVVVNRTTNLSAFLGADGRPLADLADLTNLIGTTQQAPAYTSTHFGAYHPGGEEIALHLMVAEGTPAVYVGTISYNPSEHELLLARGMSFAIDRVWHEGTGLDSTWHVQAHVAAIDGRPVGADRGQGRTEPGLTQRGGPLISQVLNPEAHAAALAGHDGSSTHVLNGQGAGPGYPPADAVSSHPPLPEGLTPIDPPAGYEQLRGSLFRSDAGLVVYDGSDYRMLQAASHVYGDGTSFIADLHGIDGIPQAGGHGGLTPEAFLELLKAGGWDGRQRIVLLACDTGGAGSFAAQLASLPELHGVEVIAADAGVWQSVNDSQVWLGGRVWSEEHQIWVPDPAQPGHWLSHQYLDGTLSVREVPPGEHGLPATDQASTLDGIPPTASGGPADLAGNASAHSPPAVLAGDLVSQDSNGSGDLVSRSASGTDPRLNAGEPDPLRPTRDQLQQYEAAAQQIRVAAEAVAGLADPALAPSPALVQGALDAVNLARDAGLEPGLLPSSLVRSYLTEHDWQTQLDIIAVHLQDSLQPNAALDAGAVNAAANYLGDGAGYADRTVTRTRNELHFLEQALASGSTVDPRTGSVLVNSTLEPPAEPERAAFSLVPAILSGLLDQHLIITPEGVPLTDRLPLDLRAADHALLRDLFNPALGDIKAGDSGFQLAVMVKRIPYNDTLLEAMPQAGLRDAQTQQVYFWPRWYSIQEASGTKALLLVAENIHEERSFTHQVNPNAFRLGGDLFGGAVGLSGMVRIQYSDKTTFEMNHVGAKAVVGMVWEPGLGWRRVAAYLPGEVHESQKRSAGWDFAAGLDINVGPLDLSPGGKIKFKQGPVDPATGQQTYKWQPLLGVALNQDFGMIVPGDRPGGEIQLPGGGRMFWNFNDQKDGKIAVEVWPNFWGYKDGVPAPPPELPINLDVPVIGPIARWLLAHGTPREIVPHAPTPEPVEMLAGQDGAPPVVQSAVILAESAATVPPHAPETAPAPGTAPESSLIISALNPPWLPQAGPSPDPRLLPFGPAPSAEDRLVLPFGPAPSAEDRLVLPFGPAPSDPRVLDLGQPPSDHLGSGGGLVHRGDSPGSVLNGHETAHGYLAADTAPETGPPPAASSPAPANGSQPAPVPRPDAVPAPALPPIEIPPVLSPLQEAQARQELELATADLPVDIKQALVETGATETLLSWYDHQAAAIQEWHQKWGAVISQQGLHSLSRIDQQAQAQIDLINQQAYERIGLTPIAPPGLEHLAGTLFRSELGLVVHDGSDSRMLGAASLVHRDGASFIVDMHGIDGIPQAGEQGLTPEAFVELLKAGGWDGRQPIVLLACETGGGDSFAARVAALPELRGVEVFAADTGVWQLVGDSRLLLAGRVWSEEHQMWLPDPGQPGRWLGHRYQDGAVAVREVAAGERGMPTADQAITSAGTAPTDAGKQADLAGNVSAHSPPAVRPENWISRGAWGGQPDPLLAAAAAELTNAGGLGPPVASGGFGTLHEVPGHPDLLVKVARNSQGRDNAQLLNEAANLELLTGVGVPTAYRGLVHWQAADGEPRTGILMDRVQPGVLSKAVLGTGKLAGTVVSPDEVAFITDRTVQELRRIQQLCTQHKINIEDIQFMIATDGSVRFIDPARIQDVNTVRSAAQRKELMKQFERRMEHIIIAMKRIVARRGAP